MNTGATKTPTIRLALLWALLAAFTVLIVIVFGQVRFDRTAPYTAVFTDVSGLRAGQFVRAAGVEVGKVSSVTLIDDDTRVRVDFTVDRSVPLQDTTTAAIRYLSLLGDRYLELRLAPPEPESRPLPPGSTIGVDRTQPALDLDALIGGFRPLFKSLDPGKVNQIATTIITVFSGQGPMINDILDQTAALTGTLADRDRVIGEVITNLNTVLDTAVSHQQDFDRTVGKVSELVTGLKERADPLAAAVAHISNAAGDLADLLGENRPLLHDTIDRLDRTLPGLVEDLPDFDDIVTKLPDAYRAIGRIGGVYGDFFNFYLCDVGLRLNGLQPGGPVREVRILQQPSGRCMPQ